MIHQPEYLSMTVPLQGTLLQNHSAATEIRKCTWTHDHQPISRPHSSFANCSNSVFYKAKDHVYSKHASLLHLVLVSVWSSSIRNSSPVSQTFVSLTLSMIIGYFVEFPSIWVYLMFHDSGLSWQEVILKHYHCYHHCSDDHTASCLAAGPIQAGLCVLTYPNLVWTPLAFYHSKVSGYILYSPCPGSRTDHFSKHF